MAHTSVHLRRGRQTLPKTYWSHTCHTSHGEIKSHRIWPIWKAIPIKKNQISQNFQTILKLFL